MPLPGLRRPVDQPESNPHSLGSAKLLFFRGASFLPAQSIKSPVVTILEAIIGAEQSGPPLHGLQKVPIGDKLVGTLPFDY